MEIELRQHALDLANEGLLALRDARDTRIRCLEGSVWITEEGDVRDTVLAKGETYTIRLPGLVVVTSLGASRLEIDGPAREQRSTFRPTLGVVPELASCA